MKCKFTGAEVKSIQRKGLVIPSHKQKDRCSLETIRLYSEASYPAVSPSVAV